MKKLLLSAVAFAALAVGPALAADLGRRPVYKAPPPPPPPTALQLDRLLSRRICRRRVARQQWRRIHRSWQHNHNAFHIFFGRCCRVNHRTVSFVERRLRQQFHWWRHSWL